MPHREHEVIHKQTVRLIRGSKKRQKGFGDTAQHGVSMAYGGLIMQFTNARCIGFVRERVERDTRKVEVYGVKRAVEVKGGLPSYVVNDRLAWPQGRYGRCLSVFPVLIAGKVSEMHRDQKCIFYDRWRR